MSKVDYQNKVLRIFFFLSQEVIPKIIAMVGRFTYTSHPTSFYYYYDSKET